MHFDFGQQILAAVHVPIVAALYVPIVAALRVPDVWHIEQVKLEQDLEIKRREDEAAYCRRFAPRKVSFTSTLLHELGSILLFVRAGVMHIHVLFRMS